MHLGSDPVPRPAGLYDCITPSGNNAHDSWGRRLSEMRARVSTSDVVVGLASLRSGQTIDAAPRLDYSLVADRLGADIAVWHPSPSALPAPRALRDLRSLLPNLRHAQSMVRALPPGSLVYTTGETWGLPLGLASGHKAASIVHVMYVHRVFSPRWLRALRLLRRRLKVDGWICVTEHQAGLLRRTLGPGARVTSVSQGVDTRFFDSTGVEPWRDQPYALCVGAEMRDYPLLFEAVRGLDIPIVIKASSAWMKSTRRPLAPPPESVEVLERRLSYAELRSLYAGARLVVVPLYDTPQAAGITTILEALAMGKCVLATASAGLPDVLQDRVTGRVVAGEPRALREALQALWDDAEERERLAQAGYTAVRAECSLEQHAARVVAFIRQVAAEKQDVSVAR